MGKLDLVEVCDATQQFCLSCRIFPGGGLVVKFQFANLKLSEKHLSTKTFIRKYQIQNTEWSSLPPPLAEKLQDRSVTLAACNIFIQTFR